MKLGFVDPHFCEPPKTHRGQGIDHYEDMEDDDASNVGINFEANNQNIKRN